ncbi:carbon-phosphorus lyase complex subunit PhnI [Mycobacterium sp. 21AC1]|uniref:carbon-phosphorus lyase complex subunit PhnI n=1 Tax=[Mycobacterium] appelbergii TaxID=2939269 RepID=UPI002938DEC1|nr:carbon-phosphorus lyase complex subunit PhnI [Mycobacterium sp. 21AC1]MDV3129746.1 carbon-phosphorus lyase complex subunit PhnI [Mycobacterium sp. 21AC1]
MYASMHHNDALEAARVIAHAVPDGQGGGVNIALLEQQVCAEAGLWEPAAARRALDQAHGDTAHAVSMLRVWAATQPHLGAPAIRFEDTVLIRRLSSAFPQVPGGQWLGFAPELRARQLDWSERPAPEPAPASAPQSPADEAPRRTEVPRVRDLIDDVPLVDPPQDGEGDDPADTVLTPPLHRANRLAMLARGETGALVALAALILGRRQEAVLVELSVNLATVRIPHPRTGVACAVADVPITDVEVVLDTHVDGRPGLVMGWGATVGTVERRAIALALLDAAIQADGELAEPLLLDEQTVIAATDGPATNGFVEHLRLPHYASFTAYLAQTVAKERV